MDGMDGKYRISTALGSVVQRYRKARGWKAADLADRADVHAATIYRVEDGSAWTVAVAYRIADALGIDGVDLIGAAVKEARHAAEILQEVVK